MDTPHGAGDVRRVERLREEEALPERGPQSAQGGQLGVVLDALGDGLESERFAQLDDLAHHRALARLGAQAGYE